MVIPHQGGAPSTLQRSHTNLQPAGESPSELASILEPQRFHDLLKDALVDALSSDLTWGQSRFELYKGSRNQVWEDMVPG